MPVMRDGTMTRIPSEGELLEFARNTKTGRVHILCGGDARNWIPCTRMNAEATAMLSLISSPCRMLCGVKTLVSSRAESPAVWEAGYGFEDDDLCVSCVRALGSQGWRAFHVDNRGDPCG